jgi:hypothetical protein
MREEFFIVVLVQFLMPDKNQMQLCLHSKHLSGLHNGLASWSPSVTEVFADDKQRHEEAGFPIGNDQFLDNHCTFFGHPF